MSDNKIYTEKEFKREGRECWYFGMIIGAILVGTLAGLLWPSSKDEGSDKWYRAYHELSCKQRKLVLNTENRIFLCMDPKTKALYETGPIEE